MKYGELVTLGNHRLYCGDCRDTDAITALMRGEQATLALHDPPYGLRAKMSWGFGDGKQHGNQKTRKGLYAPVYGDDQLFDPSHLLGTAKTVILFGANHYADKLPASAAWVIWDKRVTIPSNHQSDCEMAWVSKGNTARMFRHRWNGMIKDSECGEKRIHPTQKPVALMTHLIEQYTQKGDIVIDWYAGSGSTLLACEQTGRRCYAIEIVPDYCQKIIERWENSYARSSG